MFFNLFALGTVAAIAVVPFREIGAYYFRFHATVALLFAVPGALLAKPWLGLLSGPLPGRLAAGSAVLFALSILVENGVVRAARKELRPDALLFPVSMGVPFAALAAFAAVPGTGDSLLLAAHFLTSAAVLGTALVAMSTGHWYLANAALSFNILVRLCRLFALAVAAKAVVSGIFLAGRFGEYWGLEDFDRLVIGVRLFAGVVLAMALALMSLSCAKRKANQSATGILYVAVVFVLIGEAISLHLTLGKGWPV
jgi:hypothetical protein